jgi:hypothetical protein
MVPDFLQQGRLSANAGNKLPYFQACIEWILLLTIFYIDKPGCVHAAMCAACKTASGFGSFFGPSSSIMSKISLQSLGYACLVCCILSFQLSS